MPFNKIFQLNSIQKHEGNWIWQASVWGVLLFTLGSVLSTIWLESLKIPYMAVSFLLFALGFMAFVYALYLAAERSRSETLHISGIFWLTTSPKALAWKFRILLIFMCGVAIAINLIKLYTFLAFGILAPIFVLGLMGIWGAKWGKY